MARWGLGHIGNLLLVYGCHGRLGGRLGSGESSDVVSLRAPGGLAGSGSDLQFGRSHLRTGNIRERGYSTAPGEPLLRYRSNAIECAIGLQVVKMVRRSTVNQSPSWSAKYHGSSMMPARELY